MRFHSLVEFESPLQNSSQLFKGSLTAGDGRGCGYGYDDGCGDGVGNGGDDGNGFGD